MSIQTRPQVPGRTAGTQPVEHLTANGWRAVVVGVAVCAAALATAAASPPHPIVAVSLAGLIVLAPTADSLSRRVAINLTLALCWAPLLAWIPQGLVPGGRAAVGLAVALGAAAAVSCRGASPWSRLLPSTQPRDISLLVAGLTAAWVAGPLRAARTPEQALAMLTAGWDHASHFSMYLEQRATGTAPPFMPPAADPSGAYFEHYPQWFHSLLAMLAEVAYGPVAAAVPEELVRYATLQWVVFVLVAVLTTAAVVQALPSRAGLPTHIAAVLCTWSLVLAVPGAINLLQGHLSFLVSAVAPALIALIGLRRRPAEPSLPAAAAICGLIVVSAAWLLVVPLALVAAAGPLYRLGRSPRPRVRAAVGVMLALALAISALLAWVSMGSPVDEHITADGPVVATALPWVVGIPAGVLLLGLVAVRRNRRNTSQDLVVLAALAATGLVQIVGLGVFQVITSGQLTYYFWKMSLAVQVVVLLVAIPVLAHEALGLRRAQERTAGASRRRLFSLAAVTVLVPALGLGVGLRTSALPSVVWLTGFSDALAQRSRATGPAEDLLRWSRSVPPSEAVNVTVLATRPGDLSPAYTDQWFHSLTRTRTAMAGTYDVPLFVLGITPSPEQHAVDIARQVTSTNNGQLWVTDPALAARLQALLSPDAAPRIQLAP